MPAFAEPAPAAVFHVGFSGNRNQEMWLGGTVGSVAGLVVGWKSC